MLNPKLIQEINKIPGWLSLREGKLLYDSAINCKKGAVAVEIGSFQGKSAVYMALGFKDRDSTVYAVDPHLGQTHVGKFEFGKTWNNFLKNIKKFKVEKNVIPIRKTSKDANKGWKKKVDLLNIDGLHEYEFAKMDLKLWLPFLKENGIVVCHDAFSPNDCVWKAIYEEIFQSLDFKYIGVCDSQIFAIKGTPANLVERVNLLRSKFFINLASNVWHSKLPYPVKDFLVKRVIKIGYLNSRLLTRT